MRLPRPLLPVCAGLALNACAVGPDYEQPDFDWPQAWSAGIEEAGPGPVPWWTGFEADALDSLVETALDENREIEAALARLDAARAVIRAERSDLYPRVDGELSGQAQSELDGDQDQSSAGAAGLVAFTPDLFGRQRRAIEAARRIAEAEAAFVDDVRRLTAAATANQFVELTRARARLELLETSLELQRQTLQIVQQRYEAGLSAELEVRRAEADLARTRAQRGTLDIAAADAGNALAVLTGARPGVWQPPRSGTIPAYGASIETGLPAGLVRRRPDIRAAEAELAAATARIGVAAADLYPALSVPGSVSLDLGDASGIADTAIVQIGAVLDIPLFDAGGRRAAVDAAEARAAAALADYEQTLLLALSDVESALVAIRALEARRDDLARAVEASEQSFDQLNALYREGLATFIDILDAQRTLIDSREAYVNSQAELARAVIALHTALASPAAAPTGSR